ncbi:hypothetical protein GCM10011609_23240 [Lentzea pudingi]|uniref:FXSXX-COOH protein n=1 Tax=Lentzea pudingi TaxID=1789439 RepID=A0ABQ2HMF1_9PSEU|nr:hypothetical protein [Lentzea pudingi]GGM86185.1 hypothetical protein GCM10011609_23240 [Lentzea pudingi]
MSLSVPTTTVLDQDLDELAPDVVAALQPDFDEGDLVARVDALAAKHPHL